MLVRDHIIISMELLNQYLHCRILRVDPSPFAIWENVSLHLSFKIDAMDEVDVGHSLSQQLGLVLQLLMQMVQVAFLFRYLLLLLQWHHWDVYLLHIAHQHMQNTFCNTFCCLNCASICCWNCASIFCMSDICCPCCWLGSSMVTSTWFLISFTSFSLSSQTSTSDSSDSVKINFGGADLVFSIELDLVSPSRGISRNPDPCNPCRSWQRRSACSSLVGLPRRE